MWLNTTRFPDIESIYLDCPFEPEVYRRFKADVDIYITSNTLSGRLCKVVDDHIDVGHRKIKVITKQEFGDLLEKYHITHKEHIHTLIE